MNEEQFTELKNQIDAILFAAGEKVALTEIARLCRMGHNLDAVETVLQALEKKYEQNPSLMLLREGNAFKLQIREKYISVVKNIVTKTELTKTVMETLAVVAYKAPVLQADIIKIRTNKAYDHLAELEDAGYITRVKKGRSKLIKLTDKFFDYFDIPPHKLKEKFQNVAELEQAVEEKEKEVYEAKEHHKVEQEEKNKEEEAHKETQKEQHEELSGQIAQKEPQVKIETYDVEESAQHESEVVDESKPFENTNITVVEEKLGDLEVVDEPEDVIAHKNEESKDNDDTSSEIKPEVDNEYSLLGEESNEDKDINEEDNPQEENNTEPDNTSNQDGNKEQDEELQNNEIQEKPNFSGSGLFTDHPPKGFAEKVEKRVEQILHPEKEKSESDDEDSEDDSVEGGTKNNEKNNSVEGDSINSSDRNIPQENSDESDIEYKQE